MNKKMTYSDKLLLDKKFREEFEQEYKNLVISEKIAELRHKAHLYSPRPEISHFTQGKSHFSAFASITQEELAERVHTTKSAISRYESNDYQGYSISLLQKIAVACGADLQVNFLVKKNEEGGLMKI